MSERYGTTTDNLANVIQLIQLGRKTGTLRVERGKGATHEEGYITFVQGQITQAQGGQRTNQAALTWLSTWDACRFAFAATGTERFTDPLTALPYTPTSPQQQRAPEPAYRTRIPYRTCSVEDALRLLNGSGLSRTHRHLLLLVDGHRTIADLMRLLGRTAEEIQTLLVDLEKIGVLHP